MDREKLIEQVNEQTSGNRHDYLTKDDVTQIVDAVLAIQWSEADAVGADAEAGGEVHYADEDAPEPSDDVDTDG